LVKMPPPRRAKIEISEAPKPSATSAYMLPSTSPLMICWKKVSIEATEDEIEMFIGRPLLKRDISVQ